jgi:hypothetical protein
MKSEKGLKEKFISKKDALTEHHKSFMDKLSIDISFEDYLIYVIIQEKEASSYAEDKVLDLASALIVLCHLKEHKDKHGKDERYLSRVDDVWNKAFKAIGRDRKHSNQNN